MSTPAATSITVRVPIAIRRRGGRKLIITPEGTTALGGAAVQSRCDPALAKALARAHRWRRLLEEGRCASIRELAANEGVDRAYVGRALNLTLLAPDLVEAILDGWAPGIPPATTEFRSLQTEWVEQRTAWRDGERNGGP